MDKIVESSHQATNLVAEIADACEKQSVSIRQVTQGLDQISAVVQTNSATSEESAASSEELNSQAQTLKNLTRKIKLADDVPESALPEM